MLKRAHTYDTEYKLTFRKSLAIALFIIITLFQAFPVFERRKDNYPEAIHINILVENMPVTRQNRYRPPPPKPAVPIPTDDELVPEDETIVETNLNVSPIASQGMEAGFGVAAIIAPRLIDEVFPEYPEKDYKKGVTGTVKLHVHVDAKGRVIDVVVLENTTQSEACADAARKAAFRTRYLPARQGAVSIASWTIRYFRFDKDSDQ